MFLDKFTEGGDVHHTQYHAFLRSAAPLSASPKRDNSQANQTSIIAPMKL